VGETSVKCVERVGKSIRCRWSLDYMLRLKCSCLNRARRLRHPVRWHVVRTLVRRYLFRRIRRTETSGMGRREREGGKGRTAMIGYGEIGAEDKGDLDL
jgi:hypothetical protein